MTHLSPSRPPAGHFDVGQAVVLNAYRLEQAESLRWEVAVYHVEVPAGEEVSDRTRGRVKDVIYQLSRQPGSRAPGPGFIVPLDPQHVIVPANWQLPNHDDLQGCRVRRLSDRVVRADDPRDTQAVRELLKAGAREALKAARTPVLGELFQDMNTFVERPSARTRHEDLHYCRRYEVRPARLRGGHWVLQLVVSTLSIDAHPLRHYYGRGEVQELADLVRAKRRNRHTRTFGPTAIRVLDLPEGGRARPTKLCAPERILEHAQYAPADQQALQDGTLECDVFPRGATPIPLDRLFLILDTQITGQEHRETILDVETRVETYRALRGVLHGADAFGVTLRLEATLTEVEAQVLAPPALLLRGQGAPFRLEAPTEVTAHTLRDRVRRRNQHVKQHGYLNNRPINPLLAIPAGYGGARGERLREHLEDVAREQGVELRIAGPFPYRRVEDMTRELQGKAHNAVIAVLPEGSSAPQHDGDTHEQIKRQLSVTSQCIHHDNTPRGPGDSPKRERAARFNSQAVLLNLLVKHGWVPFVPDEPSHFNVHFGIDVGGVLNNKAMACIGYGFASERPMFRAEEIPLTSLQAEPIQDGPLYLGLLSLTERIYHLLSTHGRQPDFGSVLFFRDGDSNGQGDAWQEMDAFRRLHAELRRRGWISEEATWVVAEVSKRAEAWRVLRREDARTLNPLVGTVSVPFEDDHVALVCTSGEPYVGQGTASPLLVTMTPIAGRLVPLHVVRDLLWDADLCYTKLDHGYSLPFTLHVADKGALQLARAYGVSGLTL